MRKLVLMISLTLMLGACAGSVQNPITYDRYAAALRAYNVALSIGAEYRDLYDRNPCKKGQTFLTNGCAKRSYVLAMQTQVARVKVARLALDDFVRNNPTLDATTAITTLENAIGIFNRVATIAGVQ